MTDRAMDDARVTPRGRRFDGARITACSGQRRCTGVGERVRRSPVAFDLAARPAPLAHPVAATPSQVARIIRACPTGASHHRLTEDATAPTEGPATSPTAVTFRPERAIWIGGDLRLETSAGAVQERWAASCGCGRTANRPFRDMAGTSGSGA